MRAFQNLIRAGQLAQAARQGALIVVALALPRLGLDRAQIGEWETLLYVGYLLGFGWLTGLLQSYLVSVRTTRPGAVLAFSRWTTAAVTGVALGLLGLAALFHQPLFAALQLGDPPVGWSFFFLFLLTQWPGLFFEQVLAVRGRGNWLVGYGLVSAALFTAAILLPLYYGGTLADALRVLAGYALVKGLFILGWLALDRVPATEDNPAFSPRAELKAWGKTGFPLVLYASVAAVVTAFDPWFVNYWYGGDEAVFAVYRYGARELPFVGAVTNGAMVVVLPRLAESLPAGLDLLKAASRRLYHLLFGGAILLMATSPWWWVPVFTADFADSLPLFRAFLFLLVTRLLFPVPVLTALGHTRLLVVFPLFELALNVVLSVVLVRYWGLVGVVWATVFVYLLDKIWLMLYLKHRTGIGPGRYTDWRWFGGYVGLLVLAYWLF